MREGENLGLEEDKVSNFGVFSFEVGKLLVFIES